MWCSATLGLIGSYWSLILTHAVITMPIVIWVLLPAFDAIPRSVLEAAQVDGCGVVRSLWRDGAAAGELRHRHRFAILAFVFSWNYFLFALVLSNG